MYLVPAEVYHPLDASCRGRAPPSPPPNPQSSNLHTDWINLRTKHREAELQRNARTKAIADFMKQIMPAATISQAPHLIRSCLNLRQNLDAGHRFLLHQLLFPTHKNGRLKRLCMKCRNANLSERIMMIMTMIFWRRTQGGLVEEI